MEAIGLTGGIGAGKSLVARILKIMGYPVYVSDREASRLMDTHPNIRQDIINRFGESVYTKDGLINKPVLADIIFKDSQALADMNKIVHPRVMEDFRQWSNQQTTPLVFFESAILFEAGLQNFFRHTICVTAPLEVRVQRVIMRDKTQTEKVKERISNQMNETEKCKQADFVIYNDEQHPLMEQIEETIIKLKAIG